MTPRHAKHVQVGDVLRYYGRVTHVRVTANGVVWLSFGNLRVPFYRHRLTWLIS